ncbi:hypothetical protein [Paracoccus aminovorans]|uniref:hypothetical protein n=1 Tax=Paracoccus aminovorans TaxID=34004 RepID=UPI002B25EFEC|nr:hypothetical protein [Paracoccus aminovorans]
MAAPVQQKLIVEVVPPVSQTRSSKAADKATRALARIIGRQIARDQFRTQQFREAEDQ